MRSHTPAPSASVRLSALGGCAANASDRREVRDEVLRTAFATARGYRPAAVGGGSNGGAGDQPRAARRAGLHGLFAGGRWIRTTGTAAQKPWISGALRALRGYRRGSETIPPDC